MVLTRRWEEHSPKQKEAIINEYGDFCGWWKDPAPEPKPDMVNHPTHYTTGGMELIDFMRAKLGNDEFKGYLTGCIMKYITRYKHKNGVEDLKKAHWYLNKLIETLEGEHE